MSSKASTADKVASSGTNGVSSEEVGVSVACSSSASLSSKAATVHSVDSSQHDEFVRYIGSIEIGGSESVSTITCSHNSDLKRPQILEILSTKGISEEELLEVIEIFSKTGISQHKLFEILEVLAKRGISKREALKILQKPPAEKDEEEKREERSKEILDIPPTEKDPTGAGVDPYHHDAPPARRHRDGCNRSADRIDMEDMPPPMEPMMDNNDMKSPPPATEPMEDSFHTKNWLYPRGTEKENEYAQKPPPLLASFDTPAKKPPPPPPDEEFAARRRRSSGSRRNQHRRCVSHDDANEYYNDNTHDCYHHNNPYGGGGGIHHNNSPATTPSHQSNPSNLLRSTLDDTIPQEEKTEEGSKAGSDDEIVGNGEATITGLSEDADDGVLAKSGLEELRDFQDKIIRNNPVTNGQKESEHDDEDPIRPPDTSSEKYDGLTEGAAKVAVRRSLSELENSPGAYCSGPVDAPGDDHTSSRSLRSGNPSDSPEPSDEERGRQQPVIEARVVVEEPVPIAQVIQPFEIDFPGNEADLSHRRRTPSEGSQSIESLPEPVAGERRPNTLTLTELFCWSSFFFVLAGSILLALGLFDYDHDAICSREPSSKLFWNATSYKILQEDLEKVIVNSPCSPQALANKWVLGDPLRDTYSQERLFQRFMLASAFYSTNGSHWKNKDDWMSYNVSECKWYTAHPDKKVCDENNVFRTLNLTNNGLEGIIPFEMLQLAKIRTIDISHNKVFDDIPMMSKNVATTLEYLDLSYNKLEGQFVVENVLDGMALQHINVRGNQFTGNLPMFYMPYMRFFDIRDNQFDGKIPSALGKLGGQEPAKLEVALLGGNSLTGTVPQQVRLLPNLRILDISHTEIQGTLPQELGSLLKLELVDLTATNITGSIPEVLCNRKDAGLLVMTTDCGNDKELQCCVRTLD